MNMEPRKEWVDKNKQMTPHVKQDPHSCKIMLCVWWETKGILHWELLDRNQTINAEVYSQQLR